MSVADISGTPMSVDKTSLDDEQIQKALTIKNDRDRFFDVCEYQQDILKYLKATEVEICAQILTFLLLLLIIIINY